MGISCLSRDDNHLCLLYYILSVSSVPREYIGIILVVFDEGLQSARLRTISTRLERGSAAVFFSPTADHRNPVTTRCDRLLRARYVIPGMRYNTVAPPIIHERKTTAVRNNIGR